MGTCVICGVDVDGHVCPSHVEDVYFEFTGTKPEQLTSGRFYRGTVDGIADFGVFINIGDQVTGLLHTSELHRRLESLDWQPGDPVFVQVKNVRENGNVDLGWSIRQHESEFRGGLIDDPEGDRLPEGAGAPEPPASQPTPEPVPGEEHRDDEQRAKEDETEGPEQPGEEATTAAEDRLRRTPIGDLAADVGSFVRIEGRITGIRQTSGPTVFEIRDESGSVECAAFEAAGVRAYPDVEDGDIVRVDGEVEERRGSLQVETESLEVLDGDERESVERRLEEALIERASPESTDPLGSHRGVEAVLDDIVEAATTIRRAVFATRPIVVRHNATVDGYVAGAAIERAALALIREEHEEADAEYHYFDRRPLDGRVYDMQDAMRDTTAMLSARDRHGEKVPLFVFVDAGSTEESRDGFELVGVYGGEGVVIDAGHPDEAMADAASAFVSPHLHGAGDGVSTAALAANVAAHVNRDVRSDLKHLPALGYWDAVPATYEELAAEAGYDAEAITTLREAVALEAFYQAYEDKRELIADLLFDDPGLAEPASQQFRDRLERELRTVRPHVEDWSVDGRTLGVLDVDAFTHPYEFPPTDVLLAAVAEREEADALVGVDEDSLVAWSDEQIDMRRVGERVADAVPDAGVDTRGGRDGRLVFLSGEREAVLAEAVTAIADGLA